MYGDDTWLKLFPGFFERSDGTSSFFVSVSPLSVFLDRDLKSILNVPKDFTEVDNNVTRHIADELARDDWTGVILHYLGLDHIGHKSGPRRSSTLLSNLAFQTD